MRRGLTLVLGLALSLAACGEESAKMAAVPREPGPDATGFYCSMTLKEHQGPKGQILLKGVGDPFWFSSVRDALTYVNHDLVSDADVAGFWVNDMTEGSWETPAPKSWIDARSAWFVVGSGKETAMGGLEAVPFKGRIAAEKFASAEGGRVADYESVLRALADEEIEKGGGT